nr:MAG TPA: hypothetical protein [Bacteriophage sp.]DAJ07011.1 MAG TPA: hypothetical protein [Caudoviricetes sp.]DAM82352.1 MAG TPA: hypothetical protein [Caudoviricetes sp.]DAQ90513.1 MAG TPA: hypothetical protein [Caudoviricetes sp.]
MYWDGIIPNYEIYFCSTKRVVADSYCSFFMSKIISKK